MAFVVKDRVKETSTTTGTGTLTLAGAVSGFRSFADIGNSNTCPYVILEASESAPTQWEVGIGTYTSSGTTLSRDTVLRTSAGNTTKITLASGTHTVFCGFPADYGLEVWNQMNSGFTFIKNDLSTTQSLSAGAGTKLSSILTTVDSNPYTWWDTTNKKFLPTRPGKYLIFVGCQIDTNTPNLQALIYKNGTTDAAGDYRSTPGSGVVTASGVVSLNGSTDYVEAYVYSSSGVNTIGSSNIFFKAVYLGP